MKKHFFEVAASYALVLALFLGGTFGGNHLITVMAENQPVDRDHRIVIDAGHGGEDGGATSCTGVLESRINLEIALRLKDLFHLLGYETIMIRTSDISVYTAGETIAQKKVSDLKQRVKIVNDTENGWLISIHQNQFQESRYAGAQVFYTGDPQSQALAKSMQAAFVQSVNPGSRRQAKKSSGVYLMDHIKRPGILIECGFLSNPAEEAKLRSSEYQQRLCCVIAATVSKYLSNA